MSVVGVLWMIGLKGPDKIFLPRINFNMVQKNPYLIWDKRGGLSKKMTLCFQETLISPQIQQPNLKFCCLTWSAYILKVRVSRVQTPPIFWIFANFFGFSPNFRLRRQNILSCFVFKDSIANFLPILFNIHWLNVR